MFQFLESIKLNDGKIKHLFWHQKRVNETFSQFYPNTQPFDLENIFLNFNFPEKGCYKVRFVYNLSDFEVEFSSYFIQKMEKIRLVNADDLIYDFKFLNRKKIQSLKRSNAEIIMVKNGKLTDSSIANLVFWDGEKWITPNSFLLNGTARQRLLWGEKIVAQTISVENIFYFEKVGFINAMMDLEENTLKISSSTVQF